MSTTQFDQGQMLRIKRATRWVESQSKAHQTAAQQFAQPGLPLEVWAYATSGIAARSDITNSLPIYPVSVSPKDGDARLIWDTQGHDADGRAWTAGATVGGGTRALCYLYTMDGNGGFHPIEYVSAVNGSTYTINHAKVLVLNWSCRAIPAGALIKARLENNIYVAITADCPV